MQHLTQTAQTENKALMYQNKTLNKESGVIKTDVVLNQDIRTKSLHDQGIRKGR